MSWSVSGSSGVPSGGIMIFNGSIADIPTGWTLCDGSDDTPDLTDKFVPAAGASYSEVDTGGENMVTLQQKHLENHSHSVTGTLDDDGSHDHNISGSALDSGAHSHTINSNVGGSSHSHDMAGSTNDAGSHDHNVSGRTNENNNGSHTHEHKHALTNDRYDAWETQLARVGPGWKDDLVRDAGSHTHDVRFYVSGGDEHSHNIGSVFLSSVGNHTHTANVSVDPTNSHSHSLNGSSNYGGSHSHGVEGSLNTTGGSSPHENRPKYYALAYVMKE